MAGSSSTFSPKAETLGLGNNLPSRQRSKARFPSTAAGRMVQQKKWSRKGEGRLCRSLLAKGQGVRVADELAKAMRKRVLKRTRRVRGKAELQRGGDLFAGFPEKMLNWMFLFLITRQYLLTTERTETTDKQKAKTSKRKKT